MILNSFNNVIQSCDTWHPVKHKDFFSLCLFIGNLVNYLSTYMIHDWSNDHINININDRFKNRIADLQFSNLKAKYPWMDRLKFLNGIKIKCTTSSQERQICLYSFEQSKKTVQVSNIALWPLIESARKCRCLSFDFILLACFGHGDDEHRLINATDDRRSRATFK